MNDRPFEHTPTLSDYDWIVVNSSAGKDSQTSIRLTVAEADRQGYPRNRIIVLHAHVTDAEWPGVEELAREQAARYGLRFERTERRTKDGSGDTFLQYAERRGMWPSAKSRWCTSDFKRTPCGRVVTQLDREVRESRRQQINVLQVFGFRREESVARSKYPAFRSAQRGTTQTRTVDHWHPIIDWTEVEIWNDIRESGVRHHWAYDKGVPRLSCPFCVFAGKAQIKIAAAELPELFERYLAAEQRMGHTFSMSFSLQQVSDEMELSLARRATSVACAEEVA